MISVLNMLWFWICISQNIRKFRFLKYKKISVSWNIRNSLILESESPIFLQSIRNFLGAEFFLFFEPGLRYKKSFLLKNLKVFFLILELQSSISWNIRNFFGLDFFYFSSLGSKGAPGSPTIYYWFPYFCILLVQSKPNSIKTLPCSVMISSYCANSKWKKLKEVIKLMIW